MYKGEIAPEDVVPADASALDRVTLGYGRANWYYYNGRVERALEDMSELAQSPMWPAFGCIASEAELASRPR